MLLILAEMVKNDPDDDKFIESAAEGGAEFIVSGYKRLFKIKKYRGINIVNAATFHKSRS